ncbi:MAG: ADP-heptose synthase / D-glycero-beta-D-manno-heptose 7-phosphate kinase [uncultured Thermomicrobiales bacterium]|uniref:Bifunctional protein HldE n=1 Tax=uncultured Thermomicrobiales bacterium TaxID=1645740 RepID=A0A6J4V5F2_9BACT|nr:MAG: ADP-heptose synthase / D-glycero-beta-D-manno-heptose 7-phosphate kinase [uncultured Thermomicrobiales bacterium]
MNTDVGLVRRFRGLRALVIGDVMLDSYLEGTAARLCSEGPVPVVRKTGEERVPGGAANSAANLRALGAEVSLLGVVGDDAAATLLRAALRARGVDDAWLVADDEASTLHKCRVLADGQYVVRYDEGDGTDSPAAGARLLARLDDAFAGCDLVVISDYGYGVVTDAIIARLRALRAARPCPLVIDTKEPRRFAVAGATIITPNLLEARLAVEPRPLADPRRAAGPLDLAAVETLGRRLLAAIDTAHAAITLGGDGVLLLDRRGPARHLPAHPVPQANDVGAGDSFTAALALALAAGADPEGAVRIGIDAAGIAVTKRRTAIVEGQELLGRVSLRAEAADEGGSSRAELLARLDAARRAGRTIVFTNGVFDILHAGHIQLLRRARDLGDLLVVGVNSDRGVRRLKGPTRPINGERDRLALVAALDPVDHAILFDEDTPTELIRALRPHLHVKGGDYAGAALPESDAVLAGGGRTVILPLKGDLSTSATIDRILTLTGAARGTGGGTRRGGGR